jgi:hypothetical protein
VCRAEFITEPKDKHGETRCYISDTLVQLFGLSSSGLIGSSYEKNENESMLTVYRNWSP